MFSDAYTVIKDGEAVAIFEKLNPKLDGSDFEFLQTRMLSHSLSFYNGYSLFEVSNFENHPARFLSFIFKENGTSDDIHILNGTNEPIYNLNKAVPIFLNKENILTYVRFFFYYVRGRFGKFNIVENIDDIQWREEPVLAGRKALSKMITALELKNEDENGTYHLSSSIIFKDSLFESDIIVKEDGSVSLNSQEMLVEDLPVFDDTFQQ